MNKYIEVICITFIFVGAVAAQDAQTTARSSPTSPLAGSVPQQVLSGGFGGQNGSEGGSVNSDYRAERSKRSFHGFGYSLAYGYGPSYGYPYYGWGYGYSHPYGGYGGFYGGYYPRYYGWW